MKPIRAIRTALTVVVMIAAAILAWTGAALADPRPESDALCVAVRTALENADEKCTGELVLRLEDVKRLRDLTRDQR